MNSVRNRFRTSLIANYFRSGISFCTGLLLARFLGPVDFGRYSFLLASVVAFRQALDSATSSAFYTFISQESRSRKFIRYYWYWIGFQFVAIATVILFLVPNSWRNSLWTGEPRGLIVLAFIASFMQSVVWINASNMAEAQRKTSKVQTLNNIMVVSNLVVVIALWHFELLAIPAVFTVLAIEYAIFSWHAYKLYTFQGPSEIESDVNVSSVESCNLIFKKYWKYCLPFIPYGILGFFHDFADRWMLQKCGGASEQAYYSVALQFSAASLLATTSVLKIFWKEIAEANHNGNIERVELLYKRATKFLYFIGAAVAGGTVPWSTEIVRITLGDAYVNGASTMMLMLIYPVHQSLGQIAGTLLYATEKTSLQIKVGIWSMGFSIFLAYILLAPSDSFLPGLSLSSNGLAYKAIVAQLISVNTLMFLISKAFNWRFEWKFQFVALFSTLSVGWACFALVNFVSGHFPNVSKLPLLLINIGRLASGSILYLIFTGILLFMWPEIAGIQKKELIAFLRSPSKTKI